MRRVEGAILAPLPSFTLPALPASPALPPTTRQFAAPDGHQTTKPVDGGGRKILKLVKCCKPPSCKADFGSKLEIVNRDSFSVGISGPVSLELRTDT